VDGVALEGVVDAVAVEDAVGDADAAEADGDGDDVAEVDVEGVGVGVGVGVEVVGGGVVGVWLGVGVLDTTGLGVVADGEGDGLDGELGDGDALVG
jgi:hypothetical protein